MKYSLHLLVMLCNEWVGEGNCSCKDKAGNWNWTIPSLQTSNRTSNFHLLRTIEFVELFTNGIEFMPGKSLNQLLLTLQSTNDSWVENHKLSPVTIHNQAHLNLGFLRNPFQQYKPLNYDLMAQQNDHTNERSSSLSSIQTKYHLDSLAGN